MVAGTVALAGRVCRIGMASGGVLVGCFTILWYHVTAIVGGLFQEAMAALLLLGLLLLWYIALLRWLSTSPDITTRPVV